jgi:short-subunit dehydrogenase
MDFQHRYVLITGASGGIGTALALALAQEGANLLLHGRSETKLPDLAARCLQNGASSVKTCSADLSEQGDRMKLVNFIHREFSAFDTLINNAGISRFELFEQQSAEMIEQLITTNITAPILLTRALMPLLMENRERAPRILNIGSAFGAIGFPGYTTYCASKGALRLFSEALARELSDTPLKVQYLAPRATRTSINSTRAQAMLEATGSHSDTPERVAQAALAQLRSGKYQSAIGWPERLLVRLNGLRPELISAVLRKQLSKIKPLANTASTGAES